MKLSFLFFSLSAIFIGSIFADECQLGNQVYLAPECSGVKRFREGMEGNTHQSGCLTGVRLGYDRLKRYKWYVGGEAYWASGTLTGKSGSGSKIKSTLTDQSLEGRFGYTFQQKNQCYFMFTPFIGIGQFKESNHFRSPTPIPVHFDNHFTYIPFGFLSHFYLNEQWGCGAKFTTRYLYKHKVKTSHDPELENLTLHYKEELQYRIEIPITYDLCFCNRLWQISLDPFYEYRSYGNMANFPFDFLKTRFSFYGANLKIVFLF